MFSRSTQRVSIKLKHPFQLPKLKKLSTRRNHELLIPTSSHSLTPHFRTTSSLLTLGHLTFSTLTSPSSHQSSITSSASSQDKKMADKAERKAFLEKNLKITHESTESRFVIHPADLNSLWPEDSARRTDESARLLYEVNNGVIDFTSTYCPVPFRAGSGISEFLVHYGLDWAAKQGYSYKETQGCWYVQKFLPAQTKPSKDGADDENAKL